jgi:hypothetical protein
MVLEWRSQDQVVQFFHILILQKQSRCCVRQVVVHRWCTERYFDITNPAARDGRPLTNKAVCRVHEKAVLRRCLVNRELCRD